MNSEIEKKMWSRVEKYIPLLYAVPFLKMVAVCNNLAFGAVNEKSDIDLFIISKRGRVFIVRTFVTLILHLLGVRRHGKKIAGRFCLSFFVDESEMDMSKIALRNDIYLAFWINSMLPVVDDGLSAEFVRQNKWVNAYFAKSVRLNLSRVIKRKSYLRKFLTFLFKGFFGDLLERLLRIWQKGRAKGKMKGLDDRVSDLIVTDHVLKFHNIDRRRYYRKKWLERYGPSVKVCREKILSLDVDF